MSIVAFLLLLAAVEPERGKLVENVAARKDATQTYTLYLPSTYDPAKKHPALVIMDPRGRGTLGAEIFRAGAEELGWVLVSSNQTRSDGAWEPNAKALQAIMPDVTDRYAIDPKRIYATGFSGTAMVAWHLGITTSALAGVIGVGGRHIPDMPPEKFNFAHYGFAGEADFNHRDMRAVDAVLTRENKVAHRFASFDGIHQWMGPEQASEAMRWLEVIAMKEGRRAKDETLITKVYEQDLAAATAFLAQGRKLEALQRYRELSRTFDGLRDIAAVGKQVDQLAADRAVKKEADDVAKWDAFEREFIDTVFARSPQIFGAIRTERVAPAPRILKEFRIAELKKRAAKPGPEGATAKRLLEAAFGQMYFYLPTQLFERKEYALAIGTLTVANEIRPDSAPVWYNLATAHALLGEKKKALDALEKSFALGWKNVQYAREDENLASLRDEPRFRALVSG
jgi:tetratricopeptide (TPR) repeat protein